jgi:hypothetical protein
LEEDVTEKDRFEVPPATSPRVDAHSKGDVNIFGEAALDLPPLKKLTVV